MKLCFLFAAELVTWGPFRVLECLVKQLLFNLALSESVLVTSSRLFYFALCSFMSLMRFMAVLLQCFLPSVYLRFYKQQSGNGGIDKQIPYKRNLQHLFNKL